MWTIKDVDAKQWRWWRMTMIKDHDDKDRDDDKDDDDKG